MTVAGIDVFADPRVARGDVGGEAEIPPEVRSAVLETPPRSEVPSSSGASREAKGKGVVVEDLGERGDSDDERPADPVLFSRPTATSADPGLTLGDTLEAATDETLARAVQ
jgi:hypothetical protein